ncbi:hypothetical protein Mapa_000996 [Marchantia paleacea]|nr:hypothetical protein Mapa_000996 [Marchantia paleacea]
MRSEQVLRALYTTSRRMSTNFSRVHGLGPIMPLRGLHFSLPKCVTCHIRHLVGRRPTSTVR